MNQRLLHQACQASADVLEALQPSGCLWADTPDGWPDARNASTLTEENPLPGAARELKKIYLRQKFTLYITLNIVRLVAETGKNFFQFLLGWAASFSFFLICIALFSLQCEPGSPTEFT